MQVSMNSALEKWATWKEILSQSEIWDAWSASLLPDLEDLREWISSSGATEIWFSGAGTSAYIGDFVVAALEAKSIIPMKSVASTDLVAAPHQFLGKGKPLIVSFGRSGDSAESIGVLDLLDSLTPDLPRLHITCNAAGALATRAAAQQRVVLLPEETHDAGFAMTSSYSTMLLTALAIFAPDVPDGIFNQLARQAATQIPLYRNAASTMTVPDRIVVVGSGMLRFSAREAALKIMELTAGQIPVLWDSSLGFRHGPKSFVVENTHVIVFVSSDPDIARYDLDLANELETQFDDIAVTLIHGSSLHDVWSGVLHVLAAQVYGAVLSERLGLNVDNPFEGRGTLTRVVSGFKLYPARKIA